jgi:hypothetical protein
VSPKRGRMRQTKEQSLMTDMTVTPADLYSVTFFRIGKAPQIESDVYCNMLEAVFSERTGLYTLLRAAS